MDTLVAQRESGSYIGRAASTVRVELGLAQEMVGFLAIFAASMSGYSGSGVWAVLVTAAALLCLSISEIGTLIRHANEIGLASVAQSTILKSALNAVIACTVAYAAGWLIRIAS